MDRSLDLASAVPLAHVLVHWSGSLSGVRLLAIKGPVAAHHGLRDPRVSSDADVLVEPSGLESLLEALRSCGWKERAASAISSGIADHSVTLVHERWPCDVDVHHTWPGALANREEVFEGLYARRLAMDVGGICIDIADRTSSIGLAALHALRTPAQSVRHSEEYNYLATKLVPSLRMQERADLLAFAQAIGSVDTMRPLLEELELHLPPPVPYGVDRSLDLWRERVGSRGIVTGRYLVIARSLPLSARPGYLVRVAWPREDDLRLDHPEIAPGRGPAVWARLARLGRAALAVPRVIHGLRLARRGTIDSSVFGDRTR